MRAYLRKFLNRLLYAGAILLTVLITAVIIANKPLPEGTKGFEAEAIADSMLAAVNDAAWESLRYVTWTYRGRRTYVWDTWYNLAEIRWGDQRVLISLNTLEGRVWMGETQLQGESKRVVLQKAWEFWCNDSFWLNPIVKIRDPGTERKLVEMKNGRKALLVTYNEGGVTPGDSFLWILDESYLPVACRMWASTLPIKGLKFTWDNWVNLEGAKVALTHRLGPVTIAITDLASGDHHSDIDLSKDPFTDF